MIHQFCEAGGVDALVDLLSVPEADDAVMAYGITALEALAKSGATIRVENQY